MIANVDNDYRKECENGDGVIIGSYKAELPFFPAEWVEEWHSTRDVEEEEIKDEVSGEAYCEWYKCFCDVLEEEGDTQGDNDCSEGGVEREEKI